MTEDMRLQQHRRAALVADLIIAGAVGLLALILLAPTAVSGGEPSRCYSTFAYPVPCEWTWSYVGCATATVATSAILLAARRRRRET